MIIRKLFAFEGAHVVRKCTSTRCAYSIHGHSYKVEVFLEADSFDHGQMVYDFGLLKKIVYPYIDAFDHTLVFWQEDTPEYIAACKQFSQRWIGLPVSPSAEQLARVFFVLADSALKNITKNNGEGDISIQSVIVHETATGYAQAFLKDAYNPRMGLIDPSKITYSDELALELKTALAKNQPS